MTDVRTPKAGETWILRGTGSKVTILDYLPEHQVVVYRFQSSAPPWGTYLDSFLANYAPPPRPPLPEPRYGVLLESGAGTFRSTLRGAQHDLDTVGGRGHVIRWVPEYVDGDQ